MEKGTRDSEKRGKHRLPPWNLPGSNDIACSFINGYQWMGFSLYHASCRPSLSGSASSVQVTR